MKITNLLVPVVVSAALALGVIAQATEEMEEVESVDLKSLPAAVQKTIQEKAAGGEIVKIEKHEENGEWIYEATIRKGNKEWEFEVDAKGKILKSEEASDKDTEKDKKQER